MNQPLHFNPETPFMLTKLPPSINIQNNANFMDIMEIYHTAQKNISELNGTLREIENPHLLLSLFYLNESIQSSAVENIYTTIDSALEDEIKPEEERNSVNKEVIRYRKAIMVGYKYMKKYELSSRTIKEIHKKLNIQKGVPGEFRQKQNYIANKKTNGKSVIIYTPPEMIYINKLLGNWETFTHHNKNFFPLIKTAICHYQFEAIHPFLDGNGRTGRILLVLQLVLEKMLDIPILFISGYLNQYDQKYKDLLLNITQKGDWWSFIQFMLKGYTIQAEQTQKSLLKLKNAQGELKRRLYENNLGIRESNISHIVKHIFYYPITHAVHMEKQTKIHWQTCSKYLAAMAKAEILKFKKTGRYKIYINSRALDSLKSDSEIS